MILNNYQIITQLFEFLNLKGCKDLLFTFIIRIYKLIYLLPYLLCFKIKTFKLKTQTSIFDIFV